MIDRALKDDGTNVSVGATAAGMDLRNRDEIWSGPLALLGFMPPSVTMISGAVV